MDRAGTACGTRSCPGNAVGSGCLASPVSWAHTQQCGSRRALLLTGLLKATTHTRTQRLSVSPSQSFPSPSGSCAHPSPFSQFGCDRINVCEMPSDSEQAQLTPAKTWPWQMLLPTPSAGPLDSVALPPSTHRPVGVCEDPRCRRSGEVILSGGPAHPQLQPVTYPWGCR